MDDINATSFGQEARNESSSGLASNYTGGTERARGLLNSTDNFSENLGGGANPMQDAIRQKYAGGFERNQNRVDFEALKGAKNDHLKKLQVATEMAGQEHQMNFEKEMQRKKMANAKAAMRGQIMASVLGIAGGVGGAALGGPAGAAAGYQLGSGTGQAVGSG
jgi:hypothetical protein